MGEERVIELPAELARAIVAAQQAVSKVEKAGYNKQLGKSYATADDIAAAGKAALNDHGAAFMRTDTRVQAPSLAEYDLGCQAYAGDVIASWMIVHESGAALVGLDEIPVIVSKGRPHDKAVSASLTYGFGVTIRGVLCMEREERDNAVDAREDVGDGRPMARRGQPPRSRPRPPSGPTPPAGPVRPAKPDLGPRCSGKSGSAIAEANERRMNKLAEQDHEAELLDVWVWGLKQSKIDPSKYGHGLTPTDLTAFDLTIPDGIKLREVLTAKCIDLGIEEPEA